jgi:GNAT superfamily N-acetyltransferase
LIRDAIAEDLEPMCNLARRFVAETNMPLTFDYDATRALFWGAIHDEESIFIVAVEDGIIAGVIMGYVEKDFCVEYSAYITKLYIEKEFRGLVGAKHLIAAFEEKVKGRASLIYASATAGIDDRIEKLFVNLFQKSGYSVLGRILLKDKL